MEKCPDCKYEYGFLDRESIEESIRKRICLQCTDGSRFEPNNMGIGKEVKECALQRD